MTDTVIIFEAGRCAGKQAWLLLDALGRDFGGKRDSEAWADIHLLLFVD
jgi:hypothetical protein